MFQHSIACRFGLVIVMLLGVLLLGRVAFAAGTCTPPAALQAELRVRPNAATYTDLGTWFGDRQQFVCASEAYREALNLEPGSSRLSYLLGLSLYSAGHLQEAVPALQQSLDLAPHKLKPRLILAAALERLQRKADAKEQWQAALKIDPHSTIALHGMANALAEEDDFGGAIALLRSAPDNEDLKVDLAQIYVRLRMMDQASKVLTDALGKHPSSLRLATTLTSVYLKQFHYQAAEKLCKKAVGLHPSDPDLQRLYLQVLVLAGNSAVARPLARKLLAGSPSDFEFLYINGVLEHDAGDSKLAREHLERAVSINPNIPAAHFHLGLVLAQLGDPSGAKQQMERALELGGTEAEIHLELGKALHALGEQEEAALQVKLYQQGLQERNHRAVAASKEAQGDKAMAGGEPRQAIAFYREALNATPENAGLNFKLAVALDRSGDIASEQTVLEKAIQIDPDLASAQNQLGFLASRSGDSAAAEKHFREAVRAAPGFSEAWVNLAATLGLRSRFSEAQKAVSWALQLDPQNPQALQLRDTLAKALAQR
jgi:tetratricopeptide (TPR) repeat protein